MNAKPPFKGIADSLSSTNFTKPTLRILPIPPGKPRFHHLLGPEMDERREKGLCFNCDKKWSRNHKCGARLFVMLADSDDDFPLTGDMENAAALLDPEGADASEDVTQAVQLSLHALSGAHAVDTFRVVGYIGSQPVRVLVDGGSTQNFI